jgi:hypothetical protein
LTIRRCDHTMSIASSGYSPFSAVWAASQISATYVGSYGSSR